MLLERLLDTSETQLDARRSSNITLVKVVRDPVNI